MAVWRQTEVPFTCIRSILLSCALRNSAFGLQVRVISRQYTHTYIYTYTRRNLLHRSVGDVFYRQQLPRALGREKEWNPGDEVEKPSCCLQDNYPHRLCTLKRFSLPLPLDFVYAKAYFFSKAGKFSLFCLFVSVTRNIWICWCIFLRALRLVRNFDESLVDGKLHK